MFKAHFSVCKECKLPKLIVVKIGLCSFCNEKQKKDKKTIHVKKIFEQSYNSLPKLKKKLDDIFSIFIRRRFADENGIVKCFTCGNFDNWKQYDCGHYITRGNTPLRWDIFNCHAQCTQCNILKKGNIAVYAIKLKEAYGDSILDILEMRSHNKSLIGRFEMELLVEDFKCKIKKLDEINNKKS